MASNFKNQMTGARTAVRDAKIVKQLEFYFSDTNLPYDKFLQRQIKLDDGWVSMGVLLTFKMLKSISKDPATIASAVRDAADSIVEVDETNTKIRRKSDLVTPVADRELFRELIGRSVYCTGFPKTVTMDRILEFAATFGEDVIIKMTPMRFTDQTFKGSVYFTFSYKHQAEEFLGRDAVKFDGVKIQRMWQKEFLKNQLHYKPGYSPFNYE